VVPLVGPKVFFPLVLQPLFSGGKAPSAEAEALAVKTFEEDAAPMFAYLEKELGDRDYFVGNQLTIADITVAATLVNARHAGFAPARKKFPKLRAFLDRMWSRPSLKKLIEEDTPIFGKRAERITD
jgi:glutathione S-transferase